MLGTHAKNIPPRSSKYLNEKKHLTALTRTTSGVSCLFSQLSEGTSSGSTPSKLCSILLNSTAVSWPKRAPSPGTGLVSNYIHWGGWRGLSGVAYIPVPWMVWVFRNMMGHGFHLISCLSTCVQSPTGLLQETKYLTNEVYQVCQAPRPTKDQITPDLRLP